jgi:hypothetical protein
MTEVVFNFNQKEKIMKNLRNFLVGLVGLLFVVQLALVSPVAAQSSKQAERQRLSRVMDANTNAFLNQANADKAAGNFKSAYDNYRKAYKAAAN